MGRRRNFGVSMKILSLLLISQISFAQLYEIKNGSMTFKAVAKTIGIESDLIGTGNGLSGVINLNKKTFHLKYDLWEIDTGIELRNDHMHENYLETEDYPEVIFKGSIIENIEGKLLVKGTFCNSL